MSLLTRLTWSLSVVLGLAGLVIVAGSQWLLAERTWWQNLANEIGIATTSAGIVGFLYEHLIRQDLLLQVRDEISRIVDTDGRRLGVAAIYDSRTDKMARVKLRDLIRSAERELLFLGLGLGPIVNEHSDDLEAALARGCEINVMVFNLESGPCDVLERSLGRGDLVENLRGSFRTTIGLGQQFGPAARLQVRVFDIIPTFGAIAIDRAESGGRLYVELNCFHTAGDRCAGFSLTKLAGGLFHTYDRQLTELWSQSRPVEALASTGHPKEAAA